MPMRFAFRCDQSTAPIIAHLRETAQVVTYRTLARNVGPALLKWAYHWGYDRGSPLSKDGHVRYYKGFLPDGERVYFLVWSAYEVVFVREDYAVNQAKLDALARNGEPAGREVRR